MIETGFELLDAIVNNPVQAVILFALAYIGFKFFCGCNGFWAEMRHDLKFELKWKISRPFWEKLDDLLNWLERREKKYQAWAKPKSQRYWLLVVITMWSIVFLPMIIWNTIFYDITEGGKFNFWVVLMLSIEYVALVGLTIYRYIRVNYKVIKIDGTKVS